MPSNQAIRNAVRNRFDWGLASLKELIAIDSVAPYEEPCQRALESLLIAEGLETQLVYLDESLRYIEGFHEDNLPLENRPNLVAFYGQKRAGCKSLILNAHIDTVEWESRLESWEGHPLSGEVKNENIFGRGAVDDKGQIMMAVMAILAFADLQYVPPGEVILQSVVGEEPSGNGTLALCASGFTADAAINLEPTENQIHFGHKGIVAWRFTLQGNGQHGSVTSHLHNPIVEMGRFAEILNSQLEGWSSDSDALYGLPKVNVGTINGGTDIFTTPTCCQLEYAVRYAPGTYQQMKRLIEDTVAEFEHQMNGRNLQFHHQIFLHHDASAIDPQSELVTRFLQCVRAVEPDRELLTFPGGADARHFNNRYNIPTLLFGCGSLERAHTHNECLPLDQWERGAVMLALFIRDWCI